MDLLRTFSTNRQVVLAHLVWLLFRWYERAGPQEAATALERAGMYALYTPEGFSAAEIDEALRPAMQTMHDLVKKPKKMRRTRWPNSVVVPFKKRGKD